MNRCINTWMEHQLFMYSSKSILPSINPPSLHSIPTWWTSWAINEVHISNLNWRQFFPCQYIHVLYIHCYVHEKNLNSRKKMKYGKCHLDVIFVLGLLLINVSKSLVLKRRGHETNTTNNNYNNAVLFVGSKTSIKFQLAPSFSPSRCVFDSLCNKVTGSLSVWSVSNMVLLYKVDSYRSWIG